MTFHYQQWNSMTFQTWKLKYLNFMTFQVFHDPCEPCFHSRDETAMFGVQNNSKTSLKFCINIESNSQKTCFAIVLYTNMAATTSHEYWESEFLAIPCNWLKVWKKSRVEGAISFGFASHKFKTGAGLSQSLRHLRRNSVTTFDSNSCHILTLHRS